MKKKIFTMCSLLLGIFLLGAPISLAEEPQITEIETIVSDSMISMVDSIDLDDDIEQTELLEESNFIGPLTDTQTRALVTNPRPIAELLGQRNIKGEELYLPLSKDETVGNLEEIDSSLSFTPKMTGETQAIAYRNGAQTTDFVKSNNTSATNYNYIKYSSSDLIGSTQNFVYGTNMGVKDGKIVDVMYRVVDVPRTSSNGVGSFLLGAKPILEGVTVSNSGGLPVLFQIHNGTVTPTIRIEYYENIGLDAYGKPRVSNKRLSMGSGYLTYDNLDNNESVRFTPQGGSIYHVASMNAGDYASNGLPKERSTIGYDSTTSSGHFRNAITIASLISTGASADDKHPQHIYTIFYKDIDSMLIQPYNGNNNSKIYLSQYQLPNLLLNLQEPTLHDTSKQAELTYTMVQTIPERWQSTDSASNLKALDSLEFNLPLEAHKEYFSEITADDVTVFDKQGNNITSNFYLVNDGKNNLRMLMLYNADKLTDDILQFKVKTTLDLNKLMASPVDFEKYYNENNNTLSFPAQGSTMYQDKKHVGYANQKTMATNETPGIIYLDSLIGNLKVNYLDSETGVAIVTPIERELQNGTIVDLAADTDITSKDSEVLAMGYEIDAAKTTQYKSKVTVDGETEVNYYYKATKMKVLFESNGGSSVSTQLVEKGEKAVKPTDPTKSGATFDGWYEKEDLTGDTFDFNTSINQNTTLYAKWKEYHTVSFESNGGSVVNPITVIHGEKVTEPTGIVKDDYIFDGWYEKMDFSGNKFDFNTIIVEDIKLYAKWKEQESILKFISSPDNFDFGDGLDPFSNTSVFKNKSDSKNDNYLTIVDYRTSNNINSWDVSASLDDLSNINQSSDTLSSRLVFDITDLYEYSYDGISSEVIVDSADLSPLPTGIKNNYTYSENVSLEAGGSEKQILKYDPEATKPERAVSMKIEDAKLHVYSKENVTKKKFKGKVNWILSDDVQ